MRAITVLVVLTTISSFYIMKTEADPLRSVQFEDGQVKEIQIKVQEQTEADPFSLEAAAEDILKEISAALDGQDENPVETFLDSMHDESNNYEDAIRNLENTARDSKQAAEDELYDYLVQAISYVEGVEIVKCKKDSLDTFHNIAATFHHDLSSKCQGSAEDEAYKRLFSNAEWINGKFRQTNEYLKKDSDCRYGFDMNICVSKMQLVFDQTTEQVKSEVQRDCDYVTSLGKEMEACSVEVKQTAINKIEKETDRVSKCILNGGEDKGYTTTGTTTPQQTKETTVNDFITTPKSAPEPAPESGPTYNSGPAPEYYPGDAPGYPSGQSSGYYSGQSSGYYSGQAPAQANGN